MIWASQIKQGIRRGCPCPRWAKVPFPGTEVNWRHGCHRRRCTVFWIYRLYTFGWRTYEIWVWDFSCLTICITSRIKIRGWRPNIEHFHLSLLTSPRLRHLTLLYQGNENSWSPQGHLRLYQGYVWSLSGHWRWLHICFHLGFVAFGPWSKLCPHVSSGRNSDDHRRDVSSEAKTGLLVS